MMKLEIDKRKDTFNGRLLSFSHDKLDKLVSTMRVIHTLCVVCLAVAVFLAIPIDCMYSNVIVALLLIAIIVVIILFSTEFTSHYFSANSNKLIERLLIVVLVFYYLLLPLVNLLVLLSGALRYSFDMLNVKDNQFGKNEFNTFIGHSNQKPHDHQSEKRNLELFRKALDFSDKKIRDCMVPRTDIVAIESCQSIDELRKLFISTGFSRVLIYDKTIDSIVGYSHHSDLLKNPSALSQIVRPVVIVPESLQARKLLSLFIIQRKNMAIVVDEFGGTSGMVTIEDIIEEIFGEIDDEHDKDNLVERQLDQDTFVFSGRVEIDYLNERYQLGIPVSESYLTLAGFLLDTFQSIPHVYSTAVVSNIQFTILEVSAKRIEMVQVKITEPKVED